MAHFAELDENNIVLRVVVIDNAHEADGVQWCTDFFGGGTWIQTSYSGSFRKRFAGVGYTYDAEYDAFIPPKPHPDAPFDEESCTWIWPDGAPS
jgi:hypothetical protein